MISFDKHIEILLLDNDCVIVPNFGGFMAHYAYARWDEEEQVFLPPYRAIGFNPQLKINDNLLVQSYIERYDISYPEALKMIESEVDELNQILESGRGYEFNGIGYISKNSDDKYIFEPCEAGILTPEFYGLSSVDIKSLNSSASKQKQLHIKKHNNIHHKSSQKRQLRSYGQSAISNIAVAAVACLVFMFFARPLATEQQQSDFKAKIQSSVVNEILKNSEKTVNNAPVLLNNNAEKKNDVAVYNSEYSTPRQQKIENELSKPYYTIVLASRVTKKNATDYVEKLHNNNYGLAKTYTRNASSKVIYGRYSTENEAYKNLREMHKNEEFKEAWVMKIE